MRPELTAQISVSILFLLTAAPPSVLAAPSTPEKELDAGPITAAAIIENDVSLKMFLTETLEASGLHDVRVDEESHDYPVEGVNLHFIEADITLDAVDWSTLSRFMNHVENAQAPVVIDELSTSANSDGSTYRAELHFRTLRAEASTPDALSQKHLERIPHHHASSIAPSIRSVSSDKSITLSYMEISTDPGFVQLSGRAPSMDAFHRTSTALEQVPCLSDVKPGGPREIRDDTVLFELQADVECPAHPARAAPVFAEAHSRVAAAVTDRFNDDDGAGDGADSLPPALKALGRKHDIEVSFEDESTYLSTDTGDLNVQRRSVLLHGWTRPTLARFLKGLELGSEPVALHRLDVELRGDGPARLTVDRFIGELPERPTRQLSRWKPPTHSTRALLELTPEQPTRTADRRAVADPVGGHLSLTGQMKSRRAIEEHAAQMRQRRCVDRGEVVDIWRSAAQTYHYELRLTYGCRDETRDH